MDTSDDQQPGVEPNESQNLRKPGKVFNDSIHGNVELHPLLVQIIDTPQFQRLRYIKQLGGGYFVYPGASHNRFEHSIGVAYLAGLQARTLQENQPDLDITDRDILCLEIAGLCHDLGHGPFSHLFDQMFMPQACEEAEKEWKHEDASVKMFEYLLEKNKDIHKHLTEMNKPEPEMKKNNYRPEDNDLVFIKELILGEPLANTSAEEKASSGWLYKGRGEDKSFLYEIVSNKQNGIDVDKFDYFARDCHHLGLKNNFDHMRYFKFTRVIKVETDERKHICSRDKEAGNLYDLFHTRNRLHRRAYQHKVTKSVEIMIKDALLKANNQIQFKGNDEGKNKKFFTLSDAKNDMEAYIQLTDQITERILGFSRPEPKSSSSELESRHEPESSSSELESSRPELDLISSEMEKARNILERIMRRDLYKLVGEAKGQNKQDKNTLDEEKIKSLKDQLRKVLPGRAKDHHNDYFEVVPVTYSYGKGDKDPVECSYFYNKHEPQKAFQITRQQVSNFLPECFWEQTIRLYWKNKEEAYLPHVAEKFKVWCKENGFQVHTNPHQPPQDKAQQKEPSTNIKKENSLEEKNKIK